ncbi:hypothetical protein PAE9249_03708 [Paenibacillus sp. CECT 9249]|nr:hypothetical protein PAE9249_03708 [Paenibacillus sp. CECT 9249]
MVAAKRLKRITDAGAFVREAPASFVLIRIPDIQANLHESDAKTINFRLIFTKAYIFAFDWTLAMKVYY